MITLPSACKLAGFAEMARTISGKWKAVDSETKAKYKALAEAEKARYQREMEEFNVWQQSRLEENRAELEATVDEATKKSYFDSVR
mmetsp:Transcript_26703/g.73652  ORF Transcript_26703/g.73652 Transcript_26703/m.73652 type:complete len:86 (-) Transcript_26703:8-265(-)